MRLRFVFLLLAITLPASAQSFAELQAAVQNAPASEHAALVNGFLAQAKVPHMENDTTAVFLWKGGFWRHERLVRPGLVPAATGGHRPLVTRRAFRGGCPARLQADPQWIQLDH
ncbi:MAG: hypothetical protein O2899_04565 [Bacteroidetes bacterium]|nr:hypothetical protein [Bacteroidota bacterium]